MRKIYVLSVLLLIQFSFGQTVDITDTNFKSKLLLASPDNSIATDLGGNPVAIDTNGDGEIQVTEAEVIGGITIFSASIDSAEGIAGFSNLRQLNFYNNHLASLDVSALTSLEDLVCTRNPLTELNLAGCNNLTRLECDRTQLTSLDVSNRPNLAEVSCALNNFLATIDISGCPALTFFDCSYISSGEPGANGPLTSLNVAGCTSLETLNCAQNALTSLDLTGLTGLKNIDCSYNLLSTLSIHGCTSLENLLCAYNSLASLDITDNAAMISLNCTTNQLGTLTLSGLSALESVACSDNQITDLSFNGLSALITLYCDDNKISSLDLGGCPEIADLDCTGNQLTTLDVSMLSHLADLDCSDNEMLATIYMKNTSDEQSFVISGLPNLSFVCCDASQLENIQEIVTNYGYTGCTVTSSCELGIDENSASHAVVYPNPAIDKLQVKLPDGTGVSSVIIYNIAGQTILSVQEMRELNSIDVSAIAPGVYFIKANAASGSWTMHFIKN